MGMHSVDGHEPRSNDLMGRLRGAAVAAIALVSVTFGSSSLAAEQCAETNFDAFLARFSEDPEFQRRHVQFPLPQQVNEDKGVGGPALVETQVQSWPATGVLYLNAEQRKAHGLEVTVTPIERGKRVKLEKPDTDYLIYYFFEQRPCWRLVRIENYSL